MIEKTRKIDAPKSHEITDLWAVHRGDDIIEIRVKSYYKDLFLHNKKGYREFAALSMLGWKWFHIFDWEDNTFNVRLVKHISLSYLVRLEESNGYRLEKTPLFMSRSSVNTRESRRSLPIGRNTIDRSYISLHKPLAGHKPAFEWEERPEKGYLQAGRRGNASMIPDWMLHDWRHAAYLAGRLQLPSRYGPRDLGQYDQTKSEFNLDHSNWCLHWLPKQCCAICNSKAGQIRKQQQKEKMNVSIENTGRTKTREDLRKVA